jgi:hypothetical protein
MLGRSWSAMPQKDRDNADYLFRSQRLSAQVLRDRYKNELRHNFIGTWGGTIRPAMACKTVVQAFRE